MATTTSSGLDDKVTASEKGQTSIAAIDTSAEERGLSKRLQHKIDADDALEFVAAHGIREISPEEDARMRRRIDMTLMPLLFVTYTLNFMDKQAISYSANFDLREDNGNQYSWVSGSSFYLAYMVAQPAMSRLMQYFPIGRFVSVMVLMWGAILMTTAACRSFAGLMVVRLLLGAVESCINPAFVIITSQWYTRQEQPARISYWFLGNAIGQILGGLIGYGAGNIHSSLNVGNWIRYFIIFGAVTLIWGSVLFYYLPNSPMDCRWLSDADKAVALARVIQNKTGIMNHHWKWYQFREALLDPQTFLLFALALLNTIPAGGISSFGSIVIKGFGYSAINTTLLNMPQGAIQAVSLLSSGYIVSRFRNIRCLVMGTSQIPGLIGSVLLYVLPSSNRSGRLASYYIISTHSISFTMIMAMMSSNYSGFTKRATASAVIFMGWCAGQIIAPQLFKHSEEPRYPTVFFAQFICFVLLIVLPFVLQAWLMWCNKRRDAAAAREGDVGEEIHEELFDITDQEQRAKFRYVY